MNSEKLTIGTDPRFADEEGNLSATLLDEHGQHVTSRQVERANERKAAKLRLQRVKQQAAEDKMPGGSAAIRSVADFPKLARWLVKLGRV